MRRLYVLLIFITCSTQAAFLPPSVGSQGMVVSAQHLATQVGVDILQQGGNAIDAAVAVGYALAVVDPCCGNLGGGGFMTVHLKDGRNIFINFRERAPAAISAKLFLTKEGKLDSKKLTLGYLAVAVPGTVMGLNTALKKFGTMSLKKVMAPAIKLARQGYILQPQDVHTLQYQTKLLKNGKPLQIGDKLVQPQLAATLKDISLHGNKVFYQGWIAKGIVDASKRNGGVLQLQDFKNYHVTVSKPLSCSYRGYQLITGPPPSSGVTVCEILEAVQGFPLAKLGLLSAASIQTNAVAMRLAFYDRNKYLGDPRFVKNPIAKLLSPEHIKVIQKYIRSQDSAKRINSTVKPKNSHTTHYSVMDKLGDIVSATVTLNRWFGAKVMAGKTGFFLNDELDDFTIQPGKANTYGLVQGAPNLLAPNKQPLSSMSPTILLKSNKPILALGAAGGSTIITIIVETIENSIDYKLNLNAAVNTPRYHMQGIPNTLYYEPHAFSPDTIKLLKSYGYVLNQGSPFHTPYWGQMAAIKFNLLTSVMFGANDNRYPNGLARGLGKVAYANRQELKVGR